jgi:putative iron-regulated protein
MKNFLLAALCITVFAIGSCKKDNTNNSGGSTVTEAQVLAGFSTSLVNPNYEDIQAKAAIMNTAIDTLVNNTTEANLLAARVAWVNTRVAWESCEGFLFGPVEDNNYDPDMDDWPVNKVDLDALLASSTVLSVDEVSSLATTLKGFHAIEYVIYGVGSTAKASDITPREKEFLTALAQSLYNTTTDLRNSWDPSSGNFTAQVENPGVGSSPYFPDKQAVFLALVGSMSGICDEVANNKMQTPFAEEDSTKSESSFSHNSTNDFTHNIQGVYNAYMSTYEGSTSGHSLHELVAAKNASLDNTLQTQMKAAIASFGTLTSLNVTFEQAIYTQRDAIKQIQATINTLNTTISVQLTAFVKTNIQD